MSRRPQLQIIAPDVDPEEAAALAAAIERFMRDTAPPVVVDSEPPLGGWRRTALREGVERQIRPSVPWSTPSEGRMPGWGERGVLQIGQP